MSKYRKYLPSSVRELAPSPGQVIRRLFGLRGSVHEVHLPPGVHVAQIPGEETFCDVWALIEDQLRVESQSLPDFAGFLAKHAPGIDPKALSEVADLRSRATVTREKK